MPGEIFVKNFQFTIAIQAGSAHGWKKAIKQSYPNVIIGSQKATTNLNMKVQCLIKMKICNLIKTYSGNKGTRNPACDLLETHQ